MKEIRARELANIAATRQRPTVPASGPMRPPTQHTRGQLTPFADVAAALAGSPPEPLHPISTTFEETPDGRWAVLPDGTRIRLVAPLPA